MIPIEDVLNKLHKLDLQSEEYLKNHLNDLEHFIKISKAIMRHSKMIDPEIAFEFGMECQKIISKKNKIAEKLN